MIQQQRLAERIAETDIGEPSLFQLNEQRHMIERRIEASFIARDSRRQHRHFKTHRSQQRAKRAVQLVTDAAASFFDDLVNNLLFVENDLPSEVNVEILERHGEHMPSATRAASPRTHREAHGSLFVEIARYIHRVVSVILFERTLLVRPQGLSLN